MAMPDPYLLMAIGVMIVISWLPRILPLLLIRRRIESRFIRSFLFYVPYAVLTVMVFPAILFATDHMESALAGLLVAIVLGWLRKSLLTVAIGASIAVFIVEWLMTGFIQ